MEIHESNALKERIIQIINHKNYWLYISILGLIVASTVLFYSVRDLFGLLPLFLGISIFILLVLLRYSIKNSKNLLSFKSILALVLTNLSFFIFFGGISYDSSSNFSFDYTLSGKYGELLAKGPYYWNNYNASLINYLDLFILFNFDGF